MREVRSRGEDPDRDDSNAEIKHFLNRDKQKQRNVHLNHPIQRVALNQSNPPLKQTQAGPIIKNRPRRKDQPEQGESSPLIVHSLQKQ